MARRFRSVGGLLKNIEFLRTWKCVSSTSTCPRSLHLKQDLFRSTDNNCRLLSTRELAQRLVEQTSNEADRKDGDVASSSSVPDGAPTSTASPGRVEPVEDPVFNRIDQSFENAREAYMSKSNLEILRCIAVFQMCSINFLVEKNKQVLYSHS